MRATELSIVFEDEEHTEHVQRFEGEDADLLCGILRCATLTSVRPTFDGAVLRKVTEVRGYHYQDIESDIIIPIGRVEHGDGMVSGWIPSACHQRDDGSKGGTFDFRVTVDAVRVPDPSTERPSVPVEEPA